MLFLVVGMCVKSRGVCLVPRARGMIVLQKIPLVPLPKVHAGAILSRYVLHTYEYGVPGIQLIVPGTILVAFSPSTTYSVRRLGRTKYLLIDIVSKVLFEG